MVLEILGNFRVFGYMSFGVGFIFSCGLVGINSFNFENLILVKNFYSNF